MATRSFVEFCKVYFNSPEREHLRMGQFFVGRYFRGNWAELFYQEDDEVACEMIQQFLIDNGFIEEMPPVIVR